MTWLKVGLVLAFRCKLCLEVCILELHLQQWIIQSIVHVHNFRTHVIGCNQINRVFDPEYETVIKLNGNDCISRYTTTAALIMCNDYFTDN